MNMSSWIVIDDDQDAFWLAQVHFSTGNYTRAQRYLSRQGLIAQNPSCRYLAAHCLIKQCKYDEALSIVGERTPAHLIGWSNSRRKLQHTNGSIRSASSRSGRDNGRRDRIDKSEERAREDIGDIKFEAAMCYLRGTCYAKQNAFDRAKDCYKDAVRIDVQCFEAFDQLMKNSLMSPDEEWAFLESLDFDSISVGDDSSLSQEAAEFTKMLYMTRLPKYKNPSAFEAATETLSTHYNLADNPDLLLSKAELLYTHCRFTESFAITQSILSVDKHNFSVYPLHLACLYELNRKNELFLISHELADEHPEEPCTWLAVGVYYLTISRVAEARRFFSKASMMDPHFGPAWIGFAHTFAAEGEHDQAISAYSTAARLFQGTHLPQLFLGMQNLQLNNMTLAEEYLKTAFSLCKTDPLLLNEMGVVYYHRNQLQPAVDMFKSALEIASSIGSDANAWIPTRANLGHAYRRMGMSMAALAEFSGVLCQGGRDAGVFCAKGLVLLELGRTLEAIKALHEALAISPQDPVATDLLSKALEDNSLLDEVSHPRIGKNHSARTSQQDSLNLAFGGTAEVGDSFASLESAGFGSGSAGDMYNALGAEDEFESLLRVRKRLAAEGRRGDGDFAFNTASINPGGRLSDGGEARGSAGPRRGGRQRTTRVTRTTAPMTKISSRGSPSRTGAEKSTSSSMMAATRPHTRITTKPLRGRSSKLTNANDTFTATGGGGVEDDIDDIDGDDDDDDHSRGATNGIGGDRRQNTRRHRTHPPIASTSSSTTAMATTAGITAPLEALGEEEAIEEGEEEEGGVEEEEQEVEEEEEDYEDEEEDDDDQGNGDDNEEVGSAMDVSDDNNDNDNNGYNHRTTNVLRNHGHGISDNRRGVGSGGGGGDGSNVRRTGRQRGGGGGGG